MRWTLQCSLRVTYVKPLYSKLQRIADGSILYSHERLLPLRTAGSPHTMHRY